MTVAQLLASVRERVEVLERRGNLDLTVTSMTDDSRAVSKGSLFVAVKGERVDGHDFVENAKQAGAAAVVAQRSVETGSLPYVRVSDSRKALG